MTDAGGEREGLGRRSITAMLWGTGGAVLRIVLQVVSQIILARILGPEIYGVFAVALVIVLLSTLFADVGLAYGLIQKPSVSEADIRFVSTWQILLGVIMTAGVFLAAPWIAGLYDDPRLIAAIRLLSLGCLVNASAATSGALLRRDLDFKSLNIAAVASYAIGFIGIGIPLALGGAGVLSLVAAYLTQSGLMAAIQYWRKRHAVRPLFWQSGAPAMLDFGATVLATNLINWGMNGIDRAIVGSWLGLSSAGLYATAYNLISTPLVTVLSLLQSVFYSASAKVQDEPEQLRRGLRTLFAAITLFMAPVFAGIAASAETIILTLYGARWSGGGAVLGPLALAMPAYLLMGMAIPVLWASGATRKEFQLQVPIALLWIVVLWAVAQTGSLAALSMAVMALFMVRAAVIIAATLKAVDLPPKQVWSVCRAGAAVTLLVGFTALGVDRLGGERIGHGAGLLALDIVACGCAFFAGLRVVRTLVAEDLRQLLGQIAERMPGGHGRKVLLVLFGA